MHSSLIFSRSYIKTTFAVVLYVFALNICAADTDNREQQIHDRIDFLTYDDSIPPMDILEELQGLRKESESQGWHVNALMTKVLEIEIRLLLQQINQAAELVAEAKPLADQLEHETLSLRLQLAHLRIEDTKGYSKTTIALQQALISRALAMEEKGYAASILQVVGDSQLNSKGVRSALEQFQRAYHLFKAVDNLEGVSDSLNSMAGLYSQLKDFPTAVQYANEALQVRQKMQDDFNSSIILFNLGDIYTQAGQFESAIESYNDSMALSQALEDSVGIGWTQQALAGVFLKQQIPEKSLPLFRESAQVFRQSGDKRRVFVSVIGQIQSMLALGYTDGISSLLDEASEILKRVKDTDFEGELLKLTAAVAAMENDFPRAYKLQKNYINNLEQNYLRSSSEELQRLMIAFDTEKIQTENTELQTVNALQEAQIEQQKVEKRLWVAIVVLSAVSTLTIVFALFKQIKHRNRFKQLALKDHLTDSPNRRAVLEVAKLNYEQAKFGQGTLLMAMVDLDDFKVINDTYGHHVGDLVLRAFAQTCSNTLRANDSFGRYGGEEWLIVMPNSNARDAQNIFQRLRENLNQQIIAEYPSDKLITFSMGVAQFKSGDNTGLTALINQADENLYEAKKSGKDKIYPINASGEDDH